MAFRSVMVLILAAALASCSPGRRASPPTAKPDADTATRPALTTTQPPDAAGRSYMLTPGAGAAAGVPPMESNRAVNEQDCTKEVNLQAGNLKCR